VLEAILELVPELVPEWHSAASPATFLSAPDAKNEPPLSIRLITMPVNAPPASRRARQPAPRNFRAWSVFTAILLL